MFHQGDQRGRKICPNEILGWNLVLEKRPKKVAQWNEKLPSLDELRPKQAIKGHIEI